MKATRKVTWTLKDGRKAEVTIVVTREVTTKTSYADGYNVELGKELVETTHVELSINGKFVTRGYEAPHALTERSYGRDYKKLTAAGAYARLGDKYIGKEQYDMVMAAIAEAIVEAETVQTEEQKEMKAAEIAKTERIAKADNEIETHGPGWCDKCQSYCWGDCQS